MSAQIQEKIPKRILMRGVKFEWKFFKKNHLNRIRLNLIE